MQQSQRMKIFSKFVSSVSGLICKEQLELLHQRYYIREFKIWEIDSSIAVNLYFGIVTRSKRSPVEKNEFRWVENELRLFVWSLCFFTLSKNMDISDMTREEWEFFTTLFPTKEKILFEYQASNLQKNHNQYKKWVHEEDQLFEDLVKRDKFRLRWSDLGKALFIQSNRKFFRTAKQCRERWLNHLDPSKLKKYWLESEDFTLIEYVKFNGKKWACISKKLNSKRNQHSIKNRFKSLLTKESKIILQPCSQRELIDNIYLKLLKNVGKDEERLQSQPRSSNRDEENNQNLSMQQSEQNSFEDNMENQKPNDQIYDYEYEQESHKNKHQKDILGDISLNSGLAKEEEKILKGNCMGPQSQAFEFTKLNFSDLTVEKGEKKEKEEKEVSNQMEKRIRADLFLQDDPFQLLRGYFYKDSS